MVGRIEKQCGKKAGNIGDWRDLEVSVYEHKNLLFMNGNKLGKQMVRCHYYSSTKIISSS